MPNINLTKKPMKTLSLETSKRLQEHLKDVETEYSYHDTRKSWKEYNYTNGEFKAFEGINESDDEMELVLNSENYNPSKGYNESRPIKTFTLEEAIEFMPNSFDIGKRKEEYYCLDYGEDQHGESNVNGKATGKTALEAIENMILYLLNHNLLTQVI